jgi:hypothetical protein
MAEKVIDMKFLKAVAALAAAMALMTIPAHAGTWRAYSDGGNTVEACEDGTFTVWDSRGRKQQWGIPNAGFDRYPGQPQAPAYPRREGKWMLPVRYPVSLVG